MWRPLSCGQIHRQTRSCASPNRYGHSNLDSMPGHGSIRKRSRAVPCPNVNAPTFIDYVKGLHVDLIVVFFFPQILKPDILQTPRLGVFNCHPSLLPRYGGPHPAFWMLKNGESIAGLTVHVMTEKIDAGAIVAQQELHDRRERKCRAIDAATTPCRCCAADWSRQCHGARNARPQATKYRGTYLFWKEESRRHSFWIGTGLQDKLQICGAHYNPMNLSQHLLMVQPSRFTMRSLKKGSPSGRAPGEIMAKQSGKLLVQTGNGYLEIRSYEISTASRLAQSSSTSVPAACRQPF